MAKVTIASPFGGYEGEYLAAWLEHLRDACRVRDDVECLFLDNSLDAEFHARLEAAQRVIPAPVRLSDERLRVGDPMTSDGRDIQVSLMWQRARAMVQTEWVLTLESDVLIESDTIEKLLAAIEPAPAIGAISADVPYRAGFNQDGSWLILGMAWKMPKRRHPVSAFLPEPGLNPPPVVWHQPAPPGGVEIVDGIAFGCSLMKTETLCEVPLLTTWPPCVDYGYDQVFSQDIAKTGKVVAYHWGAPVGHMKRFEGEEYIELRELKEKQDAAVLV